ncbi:hypothetical protein NDU88_000705 [Pleurodeles waltl]|uniref:Uncharacterized protein n=1 Tax=Pleurodeles waltl TaxID=8319 RepID=A0AAV7SXS8_PLEWA|nr:hypothetical protein NDU88_000705 [Pleurodeles waltl]
MAIAMSGAEESFHQVSVRKATSGAVESSRSQSSMACLRAERVLRSMQWRWLVSVFVGFVVLSQVNLQVRHAKGPWVVLGEGWEHAVMRPGLRALSWSDVYRRLEVQGSRGPGGVALGAVQARTGADGLAFGTRSVRQRCGRGCQKRSGGWEWQLGGGRACPLRGLGGGAAGDAAAGKGTRKTVREGGGRREGPQGTQRWERERGKW